MNNRNCSLVAATTLLMTCSAGAFAQQISGTVVDKKSNETLIGAVVAVEGSNAKAVTDADGNFELNGLKNGKYTLNQLRRIQTAAHRGRTHQRRQG